MRTRGLGLAAGLALGLLAHAPAAAVVRVDPHTEVRVIKIQGAKSIPVHRLRDVLQTKDRGSFYGTRVALGKLPLVPSPTPNPFSPYVLQEDVVRIRDAYAAAGFFHAQAHYVLHHDTVKNLLDITFVIDEGPPLYLADVTVFSADSTQALVIPKAQEKSWKKLVATVQEQRGRRLVLDDANGGGARLAAWWRDRGYPRAATGMTLLGGTNPDSSRLVYRVSPGAFASFGDVRIEGNARLSTAMLRRQIDIQPGDPYSAAALKQAELDLQVLDMVRTARVEAPLPALASAAAQPESALGGGGEERLPVRALITEADRGLLGGDVGYVTDAGFTTEARWTQRNFSGGGRSLNVTGLAQTGWLALTDNPDERYRLAVSLKQPAVFHRRMSGLLTPFIEHLDISEGRWTQYGLNTTLVYQMKDINSISLDYQMARKDIYEYKLEDLASGDIDLFTFLTQLSETFLDSLGTKQLSSTFSLSGTGGKLDNTANPRRGVIVRPAVQVTAPTAISTAAYWRLAVTANGFAPIGTQSSLAARVRMGRLYPFGKSVPGPGDDYRIKILQLRDASFTAGGTGDVRGWENRLLGPKVPDVRFVSSGDTLMPVANGYVPYGGLECTSFSLELRLPLPGTGPNFTSIFFLDGGRVWTDDARFQLQKRDSLDQNKLFCAAGAGLALRSPVGPIQVSLGYKLNPSVTDLVDSADLFAASREGLPVDQLPRKNSRRWQWHLAIGASY
jgi:outer membrane protein assembly factor BamA